MSQPVWILSVDLQAKTATFQSGMADAARSARGAFTEIGSGSGAMGKEVGGNMMEARHGVMMLGEEFGVHLPRGLTTFIASLGPVGAAMETAFPFLAIILGATLALEHLNKLKEAGIELTRNQTNFQTAIQNAFNSMDEKIDQAKIKTDELRGDHLGALALQLKLIDRQTMSDLVEQLEKVAKTADITFEKLKSSWYSFGIGSAGAKNALEDFQSQYALLLAKGDAPAASGLLKGTAADARNGLDALKTFMDTKDKMGTDSDEAWAASMDNERAHIVLQQMGLSGTKDELKSQQALVDVLAAQLHIEQQGAELTKRAGGNAKTEAGNASGKDAGAAARKALEAEKRISEEAKKFYDDAYRAYVQSIDEGERNMIDATKQGSAARLAAVDAAIKEEIKENLQGTGFYRELLTERVNLVREMAEEESKLRVEAAREATSQEQKMGELALAADKELTAAANSADRVSARQLAEQEEQAADRASAIKLMALDQEIDDLDKSGNDYNNKRQQLLDQEKLIRQQHEDQITAITEKAETERNSRIFAEAQRFNEAIAGGLTQLIMGHEGFAKMMDSLGNQVVTGMMQHAIQSVLANDYTKESDAAAAARKAYLTGMQIGGPAGMILGAVMGAMAFTSVMAFEKGGIVPGVGRGDIVPAMLEPGEGVLPKQLMERLSSGSSTSASTHYHAHLNPTYNVQTIDGDGMQDALDKHSDTLTKHVETTLRRMNK